MLERSSCDRWCRASRSMSDSARDTLSRAVRADTMADLSMSLEDMIKKDGKRFMNWVEDYYETAKKEGTYVEFDDDEEEQIWTVQVDRHRGLID